LAGYGKGYRCHTGGLSDRPGLALLRLPLVASDNQRIRHPTEHGPCILDMCQGRFFSVIRTLPTYHEERPIKLPSL
jgi:hypothetical protein